MSVDQMPLPGISATELPREIVDFECAECGATTDIDDVVEKDGEKLCPECGTECPACGGNFDPDDGYQLDDGETYCPDCVHTCDNCEHRTTDSGEFHTITRRGYRRGTVTLCEECATQCDDCGDWYHPDDMCGTNASDNPVCESCSESYFTCENCDNVFRTDDMSGDSNGCYCRDCGNDGSSDLIRDYGYKPTAEFHRAANEQSAKTLAYFGIEVECEARAYDDRDDALIRAGYESQSLFYAKDDGSLHHGAELVSHPATWKYWQQYSFAMFSKLKEARWRSYDTDTCGMHVHISRSALSKPELFKLLKFFKDNAPLILRLSRRGSMSKLSQWASIDDGTDREIAYKVNKPGYASRYEAVNVLNRSTIEIRIFRGTLNGASIKRNIALCAALVEYVKVATFRQLTGRDFAAWLNADGKSKIGEPEATELANWVSGQVSPSDTGH